MTMAIICTFRTMRWYPCPVLCVVRPYTQLLLACGKEPEGDINSRYPLQQLPRMMAMAN